MEVYYCGLHRKDKQRLSYAAHVTDVSVSLVPMAPKRQARLSYATNENILLIRKEEKLGDIQKMWYMLWTFPPGSRRSEEDKDDCLVVLRIPYGICEMDW